MTQPSTTPYPDGITGDHGARRRGIARHASPLALVVLGGLVVAALSGVLGGIPNRDYRLETAAADLTVNMPGTIRNGEFFETRMIVTPHRTMDDLVIAVTPGLWRDLTVNTMIPAAAEESFKHGAYHFSYGPAETGQPIHLKFDSQINPALFGGTRGEVRLMDGDTPLGSIPIRLKVLP